MKLSLSWFVTLFVVITITTEFCSCFKVSNHYYQRYENATKQLVEKYRPVIIIPGLRSEKDTFNTLKKLIQKEHLGTEVHISESVLRLDSLFHPLWIEAQMVYKEIEPIMKKAKNGVNLIGYSQGGLTARAIIESVDHNVHNFISLSSPQAGQYGDAFLSLIGLTKKNAYIYFYEEDYQNFYSVPSYWNDPHHQQEYLKGCKFLPVLNNEVKGVEKEEYRQNFLKLNKLVLIGGPDDGVISPWESSHFSFYDEKEKVVDFRQRNIYKEDLFGLKTLDKTGRLQVNSVKCVTHFKWHDNTDVLKSYVLPWLD